LCRTLGDSVDNTIEKGFQRLFPNPNVLVAVGKGMRAVKLCNNKILQFLTGGAVPVDLYNGRKTVVVIVVVVVVMLYAVFILSLRNVLCLQCFDAVVWAAERASGL